MGPVTDIALRLLLERLLWPIPRVRWEVCRGLAQLVREGNQEARDGLLNWISSRRLESEAVLGLSLIDAFDLGSHFEGADVSSAIHAPSCLTDWLLKRNFTDIDPLSPFRYAVSPSEPATLPQQESAWFDRYRNWAVPPMFSDVLADLQERTGFPFRMRWEHDWRWLQVTDPRPAAEYPHFFSDMDRIRRGQFDLGQRDLYVSAYLRTLGFAVLRGIVPLAVAEHHALLALPMNRGLADLEPITTPEWARSLSPCDTGDIKRLGEQLWISAEGDAEPGEALLAARVVNHTENGFVEFDMTWVIGRCGFTSGPAEIEELVPLTTKGRPADMAGLVEQGIDIGPFPGLKPVTMAQYVFPTFIGRAHVGMAMNIRLASPRVFGTPAYVRCDPFEILLEVGPDVLSRWVHWYTNWEPVSFPELGSTVSSMTTVLQSNLDKLRTSHNLDIKRLVRVRRASKRDAFSTYSVKAEAWWI